MTLYFTKRLYSWSVPSNSNKHNLFPSVIRILSSFVLSVFFFAAHAQPLGKNFGVISEIVMSSECLKKPNYNLFFESDVDPKDPEASVYWYKIAFDKDCFMKLTLVPNNESDRYQISMYSSRKNEKFCNEHERIEDIEEQVTFGDNFQPSTFRESVSYTKVIEVFDNEAIYILIKHKQGMDLGHVLEILTCDDYSYILKVTKPGTTITASAVAASNNASDPDFIPKKLCDTMNNNPSLGYISFNNNNISVNNFSRKEIDSIDLIYNKPLLAAESNNPELVDSINNSTFAGTSQDTLSEVTQNITSNSSINEIKQPITNSAFLDLFTKISDKKGTYFKLNEPYIEALQKNKEITALPDKKSGTKTQKNTRTKRTAKKQSNTQPVNFIAVDSETGIVIKQPSFKLIKDVGQRYLKYLYTDSTSSFLAEIEVEETYKIECDIIGYKNYSQRLETKNTIVRENVSYYLIPLTPLKAGDKFVIPNIYFYANAPVFKEQSFEELNKLAQYMNSNEMNILIAGHTNGNKYISKDKRQTNEELIFSGTAKKLSKKRAEAVRDYLVKSGIDKKRINIKGYGGRKPIVPEPKNRKEGEKNMRVEIYITKF